MRIGVVFALEVEWTPWRDRHAFDTASGGAGSGMRGQHDVRNARDVRDARKARDVHEADIGRSHVRAAVCGVCAPRAADTVAAVCEGGADALIVAGFAGGLRHAWRAGDIVVPRRVHRESNAGNDAAPSLVALAARCGATIVDSLVTIDHIAGSIDEKSRLGLAHDIVDMETALLLAEARARGVPAVAIRVIGDPVDDPVPIELLRSIGPDHEVRPARFALEIVCRPWRWPTMARSFITHDHARKQLAQFLDRFVDALDTPAAHGARNAAS